MSILHSKPGISLAEFPEELLKLVMLNLDGLPIFTSFIHVCRSFKEFYFTFLMTYECPLQRPKYFLQGLAKLWKIIALYPSEVSETSKKSNENLLLTSSSPETISKEAPKLSRLRRILKFPDGTLIPEGLCVLVLTSDDSEGLKLSKINSIIILPETYPKNLKCLTGLELLLTQKLPALKRLALCDMDISEKFSEFTRRLELNLFCLDDCELCHIVQEKYRQYGKTQFNAKTLYINCDRRLTSANLALSTGLKQLVIHCLSSDSMGHHGIYITPSEGLSSLKTM